MLRSVSVRQLAELVKSRKVSSLNLTEMYLERLKRYDPTLLFVITLTEDRAKTQAREADRAIAAGKYKGPLHGIPWGAKDLLAVKGYPTTWGAGGFEKQTIDEDATVVKRLDAAGAVLVAKLTLGALAQGDHWYGGITRNPWNPKQGSSGSSAGPASATSAGCVGFGIGSETFGSIASPSTRCGVTGFRPTFGFVPRTGAMALSWSMDKLGPICRCRGRLRDRDERDLRAGWRRSQREARGIQLGCKSWTGAKLRIGVLQKDFELQPLPEMKPPKPESEMTDDEKKTVAAAKRKSRSRNCVPRIRSQIRCGCARQVSLHGREDEARRAAGFALRRDAATAGSGSAAAFDDLTRSGRDKLLTEQGRNDWPNTFREARFIPGRGIHPGKSRANAGDRSDGKSILPIWM